MYDKRRNTYRCEKDGMEFNLHPLNDKVEKADQVMISPVLAYAQEWSNMNQWSSVLMKIKRKKWVI